MWALPSSLSLSVCLFVYSCLMRRDNPTWLITPNGRRKRRKEALLLRLLPILGGSTVRCDGRGTHTHRAHYHSTPKKRRKRFFSSLSRSSFSLSWRQQTLRTTCNSRNLDGREEEGRDGGREMQGHYQHSPPLLCSLRKKNGREGGRNRRWFCRCLLTLGDKSLDVGGGGGC